jgi:hypothetical protein
LNPYVQVNSIPGGDLTALIAGYNIVVMTELYTNIDDALKWNAHARKAGVGFILS